jgi:hypothetical protein
MNPEQRSMGPLPVQPDPDSSQPDAEPGQRSLNQTPAGSVAVNPIGDGPVGYRQPIDMDRRFARPVRSEWVDVADSLRGHDDHDWRHAP